MIKFFRKIRYDLMEKNRTGKYLKYAIGEIALVVIGILIALQINNWNEYRKDRIKEKAILHELKENIQININLLDEYIRYHESNNQSAQIILKTLRNKQTYSDTLDKHFHRTRIQLAGTSYLSHLGYESLKNQGFDILSNKTLKNEILNLFEVTYESRIQKLLWFEQIDSSREENFYNNFIDSPNETYKPINYESLINDEFYFSLISGLASNRTYWVQMLNECKIESKKILNLIIDELELD